MIIEARGVNKRFGRQPVLQDLDLDVRATERVALVGHNGSGKTTLIRCLLGLYRHSGRVSVLGRSPRRARTDVLAEVGFVPQLPPAIRVSVDEYLSLVRSVCGLPEEDVLTRARELGLDVDAVRRRAFAALSGGMKQKLLIAVAIARRPKLLVLDEPGANLDPMSRAVFFQQLSHLSEDTTMLLSSHRVDELAGLVTRVVELDAGRKVLDDVVALTSSKDLDEVFRCRIELAEAPVSVRRTLGEWGFTRDGEVWSGTVAAPDRFRFMALVTRWSGLVRDVHLGPEHAPLGRKN